MSDDTRETDDTPSVLDELAAAFQACAKALVAGLGKRAPVRRRPRRVAKKLEARGGFLHYDSAGAFICLEREDLQRGAS